MEIQPPGVDPTEYVMRYRFKIAHAMDAARLVRTRSIAINEAIAALLVVLGVLLVLLRQPIGWAMVIFGVIDLAITATDLLTRVLTHRAYGRLVGSEMGEVFTTRGIHATSPLASVDIPWSAVTEVIEDDRTLLFKGGRVLLAYVPTDGFESPSHRRDATAFARQMVAASQPARSTSA